MKTNHKPRFPQFTWFGKVLLTLIASLATVVGPIAPLLLAVSAAEPRNWIGRAGIMIAAGFMISSLGFLAFAMTARFSPTFRRVVLQDPEHAGLSRVWLVSLVFLIIGAIIYLLW